MRPPTITEGVEQAADDYLTAVRPPLVTSESKLVQTPLPLSSTVTLPAASARRTAQLGRTSAPIPSATEEHVASFTAGARKGASLDPKLLSRGLSDDGGGGTSWPGLEEPRNATHCSRAWRRVRTRGAAGGEPLSP